MSSSFFILGNPSSAVPSNLVVEISASIGSFPIDSLRLVPHLLSRFPSTYFRSLILNRKLPYHSRYPPSNYIESLVLRRLLIMNHFRGVGSTLHVLPFVNLLPLVPYII